MVVLASNLNPPLSPSPSPPRHVLSGSYNNYFHIYDREASTDTVLQADKSAFKAKKIGGAKGAKPGAGTPGGAAGAKGRAKPVTDVEAIDFNKKILHGELISFLVGLAGLRKLKLTTGLRCFPPAASWHPKEDTIAIAATNNLFLYSRSNSSSGGPP